MPKKSQKSIFDAIRLENLLTKNLPTVLEGGETDINPDSHNGSYELVREAVCMLAKEDINGLDIKDLEFLYFMTSWRKLESSDKENRIERSHLSEEHKKDMHDILDKILQKTKRGEYKNGDKYIGMFRPATWSVQATNEDARNFLQMCIDIEHAHSDEEMFGIAEDTLKNPMKWIGIATVSQILHCLKPTVFPVFNGQTEVLGFSRDVSEYVENTRKLKILRDERFSFKNYRVIDLWLWEDNPEDDLETALIVSPNLKETPWSPQRSFQPLNQILYGPPGTGKTYHTINYAFSVIEGKSIEELENEERNNLKKRFDDYTEQWQIVFTTFHQSFSYEDFIEGLRADVDGNGNVKYKVKDGIFKELAEEAWKYPNKPHILIIDEINRGNISKIFGELITLIEESKRWWNSEHISVKLPYSGGLFSVPNNLFIIGTMNTTDRSIALIDTALRRRFDFVEMAPQWDCLEDIKVGNIQIKEMFEVMNERIKFFLDRDHCIGHAYFLPLKETPTLEELNEIFQRNIRPLSKKINLIFS